MTSKFLLAHPLHYMGQEWIMFTYECLVKFGHMGAGHSYERNVRIKANSVVDAMRQAKRLSGAKKGRSQPAVMRVAMVH